MDIEFNAPLRGNVINTLATSLAARTSRLRSRRNLKTLLDLDDHLLDDIGVLRYEVEDACSLPLSVDAVTELRRISRERRRRPM